MPSMVGGRLTRFCFPLMKMVMYSFCRRFFSAFSAAVSFLLRFAMMDTEMSGFWSSEAAEKIRSIELCTPGMGVNLWVKVPYT